MWNLNKTGILLPKICGNCLPEWRGVLEETRPAPSPRLCLERSVAQLQKLLSISELCSCASWYTALTYFTRHTHQFYTTSAQWHQWDYPIPALDKTRGQRGFTEQENALVTYFIAQTPSQETKSGDFTFVPFISQSMCLSGGLSTKPACCPSVWVCLQCLLQSDPSQQMTELQCLMYLHEHLREHSESALN